MKNVILQRTIAVRCWHVIGRVARASKRPELMPVLIRARERGRTSVDDIAEHLLFERRSRRIVSERLLHIAVRHGLLSQNDHRFELTEAGAAALESEHVFVPEQGAWTTWVSDDPLLDYPVLRIQPWDEPNARDELHGKDKPKDDREPWELPVALREACGRIAKPAAGSGALIRIDELAARGEEVRSDASLRIVWHVAEGRSELEGTLAGDPVNTVLAAPPLPAATVWRQLLAAAGLWPHWDDGAKALRVSFAGTTDGERESMRRDLAIARPILPAIGAFDALTISDVALQAATAQEALAWAGWRLRARVRECATAVRFNAWSSEATSPFAEFRPALPTRQQLAAEAWQARGQRPTAAAWHLVAAEDWSL